MNASGTAFLLLDRDEARPDYLTEIPETYHPVGKYPAPAEPFWSTLYIGKGKKDKVNKMDIVGFPVSYTHLGSQRIRPSRRLQGNAGAGN